MGNLKHEFRAQPRPSDRSNLTQFPLDVHGRSCMGLNRAVASALECVSRQCFPQLQLCTVFVWLPGNHGWPRCHHSGHQTAQCHPGRKTPRATPRASWISVAFTRIRPWHYLALSGTKIKKSQPLPRAILCSGTTLPRHLWNGTKRKCICHHSKA